ncbi:MAG: hypothetical protein N3A54_02155 [Patescibacteria group bacterium]|nr:hypothetical protein [Patescibacteria group bacterium]
MANYLVNKTRIKSNISKLKNAFADKGLDFEFFYSVKTNFCKPVLEAVKESDSDFEILSNLEWEKVRVFKSKTLVLNGPVKQLRLVNKILTEVELLYFNIDNDTDFDILSKINPKLLNKLGIGLRVYLNETDVWNRFGYDIASKDLSDLVKKINSIKKLSGFHFHFSTNNFKISNYQKLFFQIKDFCENTKLKLEFLDIGGGLPAANEFIYESEIYQKLPVLVYETFHKVKIISEAGRNIVADAVDLATKVISCKKTGVNKFQVNIDANIMHFPCYYEKKYWVEYIPKQQAKKQPTEVEIFGNSCMQIDRISDLIMIDQAPRVGDKVIIHNIGAYSYSQSANFISSFPKVKIHE